MDSEHTHVGQEVVRIDGAVPAGNNEAAPGPKRLVSPYSLVPALTLVALQFAREDQSSLWDIIMDSSGRGAHRPVPKE